MNTFQGLLNLKSIEQFRAMRDAARTNGDSEYADMMEDHAKAVEQAIADSEELAKLKAKLPKTADGAAIHPGLRVWGHDGKELIVCLVKRAIEGMPDLGTMEIENEKPITGMCMSDYSHLCFSSKEAARNASIK